MKNFFKKIWKNIVQAISEYHIDPGEEGITIKHKIIGFTVKEAQCNNMNEIYTVLKEWRS